MHKSSHIQRTQAPYLRQCAGNPPSKHPGCLSTGPPPWQDLPALGPAKSADLPPSHRIHRSFSHHLAFVRCFSVECNVCYYPRIKLKCPYHNYYSSSFYQFWQLELLICTSTLVFKHFLYTIMPYISNVKIGCNFVTPYFQHTRSNARGIQLVSSDKDTDNLRYAVGSTFMETLIITLILIVLFIQFRATANSQFFFISNCWETS